MNDWTSIKSVLTVVQLGSLSAAAKSLGIHHTTVLRQITTLEEHLQVKLFDRHARGYVPTESGKLLADAADIANEELNKAFSQILANKESRTSELIITTIPEYAPLLAKLVTRYQRNGSKFSILIRSDERIFDLKRGEAQIGIRAGPIPTEPDYVVQLLERIECTLCAHQDYIKEHGELMSLSAIEQHQFLMTYSDNYTSPEMQWISDNIPKEQVVLKTNDYSSFESALLAGLGIGPLPLRCLNDHPNLAPILRERPPEDWATDIWIVTHFDMHWTENIQHFLKFFKEQLNIGLSHKVQLK